MSATAIGLACGFTFPPLRAIGPGAITRLVVEATAGMPDYWVPLITARRLRDAEYGRPVFAICDDGRPVGWYGWFPSESVAGAWETTTFFVPEFRGSGLYDVTRCRMAHLADDISAVHGDRARFVSLIDPWNERSLAATRSYAARHGWPDEWSVIEEPGDDADNLVFTWPSPAPHTCRAPQPEPGSVMHRDCPGCSWPLAVDLDTGAVEMASDTAEPGPTLTADRDESGLFLTWACPRCHSADSEWAAR